MKKRRIVAFLSALIMLAAALAGCRAGASDKRADLLSGGSAVAPLSPDAGFSAAYTDLALKLLSACLEDGKNTLVSPLSVMEALAMMANGACGETLGEMERVIGRYPSLQGILRALPPAGKSCRLQIRCGCARALTSTKNFCGNARLFKARVHTARCLTGIPLMISTIG